MGALLGVSLALRETVTLSSPAPLREKTGRKVKLVCSSAAPGI